MQTIKSLVPPLLCLAALLPSAASASEAQTEVEAGEAVATQRDVFDSARDTARSSAEWLARSVDSWFGDRPFEQGGKVTDGRLDLNFLHRRDEGNDYSLRFNARFRLPNVEERLHVFLGRDDERELIADTPGAFTRQDRLQPAQRSERRFFAGLGYDWRDNIDFRLGFRGGLKPYAQARFRERWAVEPQGTVEFRETLFWSLRDHFGSTTALSYEHAYTPTLALRWLGAATITRRNRHFDWSSDLGLYKDLGEGRLAAAEALVAGLSGSGVPVREWGLRGRWQQPLHRSWLLGELIVGRFWVRPDETTPRQGVWAVGLGLKMRF